MVLSIGLWLALFSLGCVDCLTCLHCTDTQNPRHCKHVTECTSGEVCRIHQKTTKYGEILFDLGCIGISTCSNRSQGIHSCDECCSTDLCNSNGCGKPGYPSSRGPICYSCSDQSIEGSSCHNIDFCGSNEVCMISEEREFGDTVYTSQCVELANCENIKGEVAPIIGRSVSESTRSATEMTCHKCCHGDLCNAHCSTKLDYCTSSPCVHGQCVNGMTGYTCVCDPTYNGHNCSEVNYCASSPCVHGICVNGMTGYTCFCDPKYNGHNCSEVNYCASSPCVHGSCVNGMTGYTCVCDPLYNGQNCSELDYCSSNPCVNGRCVNGMTGYTCVCDPMYNGQNCSFLHEHLNDCLAIKNFTQVSGVYKIHINGSQQLVEVYCDMQTDGGGWTVFQRRVNGSVDFYKNFTSYENGFGDVYGEFWLGLKNINVMTSTAQTELRIDLTTADGSTAYEVFSNFRLSAAPYYMLRVDPGHGTADNGGRYGFSSHSGSRFYTYDNDDSNGCAQRGHGAWWYMCCCANANLNGQYVMPGTVATPDNQAGIFYYNFKSFSSMKETKMMIRRG